MMQGFGKWAVLLVVLTIWLTLPACSSKEPRYPAEHARFLKIDEAVETLRTTYVRKDLAAIQAIMLPLDQLERLQKDISKDFEIFQEISLDFSIDRIVIEGDTIDVSIHWQGQWKRPTGEAPIRERGHGMLRWVGMQSILLSKVEGDMPFGMALRHADVEPRSPRPR